MRAVAVVTCIVALAGFTLWLFGPKSAGTFGLAYGGGQRAPIASVADDSPFRRDDVRTGDVIRFDRMPLAQRLALTDPVAGVAATIAVERGTALRTLSAVARAAPTRLSAPAVWLLTLLYAALSALVAWCAPPGRLRAVIMSVLAPIAIAYSVVAIAGSMSSPLASAIADLTGRICISIFLIGAFLFIVDFPPRSTRLTPWLKFVGFPVAIIASTLFSLNVDDTFRILSFDLGNAGSYFEIAGSIVWIVGIADAVTAAGTQYRGRVLVAGSTLFVLSIVNILDSVTSINGWQAEWIPYVLWLQWASGFGVSYAVLRHRLLDLNVVISRAAIFSTVSLSVIAAFVLAEWVLATILERAIGPDFGESGRTALTAFVALCVGLSARGIHYVVEHRLNRVFFAKRYRGLADLHRFALETDVATDSSALLALTVDTLRRNLAAEYVAVFTGTPESGYIATGASVDSRCPLRIDQNEEIVLRLRRFSEPFVVDNESHPLTKAFISPMILRGTLYGFAICGPKLDQSSYLSDERETVADLAHRVGIAYEWLTRAPAPNFAERSK